MQGIGKRWIELRAKADQAGRSGRGQFEHARKSGSSDQQMSAIRELRINPVAGFFGIFQRLKDESGIAIAGRIHIVAKKQRCSTRKQFLHRLFGTAHGDLTT
ncbi:hypothetical protein [Bradyrhizobium sp. sGM-13]|uniref:hypothetical protein n=1 Tax=Bradyrhizobium sp. sGM-13 TaxID=2831781 RepID=UPI001BCD8694|nr:hypothetical protein [Bradyrhizobium sp. sGM-13]